MKDERNKIPVTVQLILKKENKVLLLKRTNTGFEDNKYAFIGGHVDNGEEIKKAMIREAKEEVDIDVKENDLKVVNVMNRKVNGGAYIDFVLTAENWEGTPKIMEKEKCNEIMWADINNLPDNIVEFEKVLLKNNNDFYIPLGWD